MSDPSNVCRLSDTYLKSELNAAGYDDVERLANTLQGAIYTATQKSTKQIVAIKATNKYLSQNNLYTYNNKVGKCEENILLESQILKHLTQNPDIDAPKSIIKYIDLLESPINYYLIMEHGGSNLLEFIIRGHKFIQVGQIKIEEWHKVVKVILKQMIESIEYIHQHGVSHYDISLENYLISDPDVQMHVKNDPNDLKSGKYLSFNLDTIQIKLIDFGLAGLLSDEINSFSNKYVGKTTYKSPEVHAKQDKFDPKKNDIFCLGVSLFMMLIGSTPWTKAKRNDPLFHHIFVVNNGNIGCVLKAWNKYNYIQHNTDIIDLFQSVFQYEKQRISLYKIKNHCWLK